MNLADMIKLGLKGIKPSEIKELNASGISADDAINLAKNGYTVTDMKELISLAGDDMQVQPGNNEPNGSQGPAIPSGNEGDKGNDDITKALEAENEKLKADIKKLQSQNASRNLGAPEPVDNRKQVQEIFKSIY